MANIRSDRRDQGHSEEMELVDGGMHLASMLFEEDHGSGIHTQMTWMTNSQCVTERSKES